MQHHLTEEELEKAHIIYGEVRLALAKVNEAPIEVRIAVYSMLWNDLKVIRNHLQIEQLGFPVMRETPRGVQIVESSSQDE